jgi:hypothetical protein
VGHSGLPYQPVQVQEVTIRVVRDMLLRAATCPRFEGIVETRSAIVCSLSPRYFIASKSPRFHLQKTCTGTRAIAIHKALTARMVTSWTCKDHPTVRQCTEFGIPRKIASSQAGCRKQAKLAEWNTYHDRCAHSTSRSSTKLREYAANMRFATPPKCGV